MLSRLGISARLVAIAGLIALGLALIGVLAYRKLDDVVDKATHAEHNRVPQLNDIAHVELNITRVSLQLRHAMLSRTPQERQASLDDIALKRKLIDKAIDDYESRLYTDEGRRRFAPVRGLLKSFWTVGEANLALIVAGQREEAFDYLVSKTIPARNALLAVLDDTVSYQTTGLSADIDGIETSVHTTLRLLLASFLALALTLFVFAGWLRHTLQRRVSTALAVAERVRNGDLTTPVLDNARDEMSPLLAALQAMQTGLARVVSSVRQGADSVVLASTEMAQGNLDLSSRTERQASTLQQTAATMEELGSTVDLNAQSSSEASRVSVEAAQVAAQGGALMQDLVATMGAISEASERIGNITNVIDTIAFQTNILALNAAVEAARAGDHGRGFAVVAGEVRSLASRSAEAAREIKSLIGTSLSRVESGARLVSTTGETMQDIVRTIGRVNDIVREVSQASQSQSRAVGQMNEAIGEIDRATQQNAALVEQSAAAADTMRKQAEQLASAVSAFRLA